MQIGADCPGCGTAGSLKQDPAAPDMLQCDCCHRMFEKDIDPSPKEDPKVKYAHAFDTLKEMLGKR